MAHAVRVLQSVWSYNTCWAMDFILKLNKSWDWKEDKWVDAVSEFNCSWDIQKKKLKFWGRYC